MRTITSRVHAERSVTADAAIRALGERIRVLRGRRGFSLEEFATLVGVPAIVLGDLERGVASTPLWVVVEAAEVLGVAVATLFSPEPPAAEEPPASEPQPATATPPADYVPLEVPSVWEPPPVHPAPIAQPHPAVQAALVEAVATVAHAQVHAPAQAHAPSRAQVPAPAVAAVPKPTRVPRTFADLRTGPLAERTFDTLPDFAVAAVVEAGHTVSAIARVFRVPAWKLQAWVDERQGAPASAPVPRRYR